MSVFFNSPGINPSEIDDFISSTFIQNWDYMDALGLSPTNIRQATYDEILSNPGDVADGVVKVEMKFGTLFFGIFNSLIIKYRLDNSVQLMFSADTDEFATVLTFYQALRSNLGGGTLIDHKFSSFNDIQKVKLLSEGQYSSENDEIIHVWNQGNFSFTLNYRIDPLRQFVFSVSLLAEKEVDRRPRTNGTVLSILKYNIHQVLSQKAIKEQPRLENGEIKFIDYTFPLDPPELGIFEELRIRVFDPSKRINENIQTHLTYYSNFEIDTAKIITFCDRITAIYGRDNYGDAELQPHELDMLDESEFWTGRSWLFNTSHAVQDLSDSSQNTLYGVTITLNPQEDGLCLHILAFNKMMDYDNLMLSK